MRKQKGIRNGLRLFVFRAVLVLSASYAQATTKMYFVHTDHLGTPQVLTDSNQEVVWEGHRSPFGEAVEESGSIEQPLRFPGQYADPETGFSYNYFRDYDPSLGRYVQSDPIGLEGGLNTYAYGGANPLGNIDPLGLAYSPVGEHSMPRLSGGKDPNECGCLKKILGGETAFGVGLVLGGQPGIDKPFNAKGATSGTSPLSKGLSKAFPQKLPRSVWAPTVKNPKAKTNVVGRGLGRWAPIIGWGLLSLDYVQYMSCIAECDENECR